METGEQCPKCGNDFDPMHPCKCRGNAGDLDIVSALRAHTGGWCFQEYGDDGNLCTQGSFLPTDAADEIERLRHLLEKDDLRTKEHNLLVRENRTLIEALEARVVAAYERGAAWMRENPDSSAYVSKAARDYADKTRLSTVN